MESKNKRVNINRSTAEMQEGVFTELSLVQAHSIAEAEMVEEVFPLLSVDKNLLLLIWAFFERQEKLRTRLVCKDLARIGSLSIHYPPLGHCGQDVWSSFTVEKSRAFPEFHSFFNILSHRMFHHILQSLEGRKPKVRMVDLSNYEGPWPEDLLDQLPNLSKIRLARVSSEEAAWLVRRGKEITSLHVEEVTSELISAIPSLWNLKSIGLPSDFLLTALTSSSSSATQTYESQLRNTLMVCVAQHCPKLKEITSTDGTGRISLTEETLAVLFSHCRALKVFKCQGLARSRAFLGNIAQFRNLQI